MSKRTFESAMKRLEEIVSALEQGNLTLEQSLKMYEEGVELTKFCSSKLEEAESKIKLLSKNRDAFEVKSTDL
ncbi:MAG: exodeoxyribonuclease VII small subunit [Calditrichaeota bacterium]|nr:MAG: exodeoxyribonuclease VII small subunit [Calditrichota bacterium]